MKNVLALMALFAAVPVAADTVDLKAPMAGATIHGTVGDISVYWQDRDGAFEVVAIFAAHSERTERQRAVMLLEPGDDVAFGFPGARGTLYEFEASEDSVTVSSTNVYPLLAQK